MAILDLDIDSSTEAAIWQAFDGWSEHFKRKLREDGPSRQIRGLRQCLEILTDDDKQMYSYDWLYYIQKRDALFVLQSIVPPDCWARFAGDVEDIDRVLRAVWVDGPAFFPNPREPQESYWWWYGLPSGVLP